MTEDFTVIDIYVCYTCDREAASYRGVAYNRCGSCGQETVGHMHLLPISEASDEERSSADAFHEVGILSYALLSEDR